MSAFEPASAKPAKPHGQPVSRRHALKILAAAVALPAGALALRESHGTPVPVQWHGETLGGQASLTLWHRDAGVARRTIASMLTEVERLETVFSLYRPDSEIVRLNRTGRLNRPSHDLVSVIEEARRIASASRGAFNPAVQPLWDAYSRHFATDPQAKDGPDQAKIDAALARCDFGGVDAGPRVVAFRAPGMALTLNGIAQGYITDRIADLLRQEGFDRAMVELGETRAIGSATDGRPFTVNLVRPGMPGEINRRVELADTSLSVSGGYGLRFGRSGAHHIFDPSSGLSPNHLLDVAVIAPRAGVADGLSTAIFVAGEAAAPAILALHPAARALLTRADGSTVKLGA